MSAARPWIVVLTWNGRERLSFSLPAADRLEGSPEILVVDNASHDGGAERARELLPRVHVLRNERNLGFAGGNNRGISYALERGATHVVLVNDDMALEPDWWTQISRVATREPRAAILGGLVLFVSRPDRVNSTGLVVDRFWRARDRDFDRPLAETREIRRAAWSAGSEVVTGVTGGAICLRRDLLEHVGLLDERLFAYYEDLDLCLRARANGFESRFVPAAVSHHQFAATLGVDHPKRRYLLARNHLLIARRYAPRAAWPLIVGGTALYRLLVKAPAALLRGRADLARAELHAVRDALFGSTPEGAA